jgi:riboflavin synthase
MFTGLIETVGSVLSMTSGDGAVRLIIAAPQLSGRWRTGDSIAVNGVCLTALPPHEPGGDADRFAADLFAADLAEETLRRTTLSSLEAGALVNLELPTPAGSPLGGHVVQGHVDGTGTLVSLVPLQPDLDTTDWRMTIELPSELAAHVISQGSITVEGISLTVAKVLQPEANGATRIEIAVIPHTYKSTNLRGLKPGAPVNIETDVLSKYAARRGEPASAPEASEWLTPDYLLENGY